MSKLASPWQLIRLAIRAAGSDDAKRVAETPYAVAVQMLRALGVERLELFGNNPDKVAQLRRHGVTVTHRVSTSVHLTPRNARYLAAKVRHGAHALDLPDIATTDLAVPDVAAGQ